MAHNSPHRRMEDSVRLAVAALLAVLLHLALAQLPLAWRSLTPAPARMIQLSLSSPPAPATTPAAPMPTAVVSVPEPTPKSVAPAAQAIAKPVTKIAQTPKSAPNIAEPKPRPAKPISPTVMMKATPSSVPKPARSIPTKPQPAKTKPVQPKPIEAKSIQPKPAESMRIDASSDKPDASDLKSPIPSRGRYSTMQSSSAMANDDGLGAKPTTDTTLSRKNGGATTILTELKLQPLPGNPQPRYPALARRRGQEGQVLLRLSVNAAGQVETISIARSSGHDLLDQEAQRTVMRWRFPSSAAGGMVTQPISFRLQN